MSYLKGGAFVFQSPQPDEIFLPELANEEQKMIYESSRQFVKQEITPVREAIEAKKEGLSKEIFKKMGEVGLLGLHMPEAYGGSDMDANTVALMLAGLGVMGSFNTPYAAHTGIGMLPILYFGNEAQKEKYLPAMITGELIASYCLTEPTSGSDALSAKTQAVYDEDKKVYILNGQKMWISNAGYAGIFIVFAQIDGQKFTAFIVERDRKGLTLGEEEDKMGIHGSSTRQVFLEDVEVPEENLLGEKGKGHLIAFNVLNMGRFKLGTMTFAGCRESTQLSAEYAVQRHQFGQPIGSFGAIKYKIARQTMLTAALSSASFRLSESLTRSVRDYKDEGKSPGEAKLLAAKDFAVECSILKIAGSESLDYVVDEMVQIYGGMGYSEEAPAARMYRDARINRIYEGTNEINRLLIVDQLVKRGLKGELPLMDIMQSGKVPTSDCAYANVIRAAILKLLTYVGKAQMEGDIDLEKNQQMVMAMSDIVIELYMLESLWMRMVTRKKNGLNDNLEFWAAMYELKASEAIETSRNSIVEVLSFIFDGDTLKEKVDKVLDILPLPLFPRAKYRIKVADAMMENTNIIP